MTDSNISSREQNQYQEQLSIGNGTTHDEEYPYLSDISQLLHGLSTLELQGLCTIQEMLLAKSCWEATNYSGSQEKCKKRLTELYGEDWDEHVKFRDYFVSIKPYYIWSLLISHRQQWNELKK